LKFLYSTNKNEFAGTLLFTGAYNLTNMKVEKREHRGKWAISLADEFNVKDDKLDEKASRNFA